MSDIAQVDVEVVLLSVGLEQIRLRDQIIDDVRLLLFIFEVGYLRSAVSCVSHVRWHADEVFVALRILENSLARADDHHLVLLLLGSRFNRRRLLRTNVAGRIHLEVGLSFQAFFLGELNVRR